MFRFVRKYVFRMRKYRFIQKTMLYFVVLENNSYICSKITNASPFSTTDPAHRYRKE